MLGIYFFSREVEGLPGPILFNHFVYRKDTQRANIFDIRLHKALCPLEQASRRAAALTRSNENGDLPRPEARRVMSI